MRVWVPWRYVLYICLHTATCLFSTRLSDIAEQATEKIDSMAGGITMPRANLNVTLSFLSTSFTITNPFFFSQ